jgi:hypothetical protein
MAHLAPNFGLGLTKLTLFSQIRIPNAVQKREWNIEPLNPERLFFFYRIHSQANKICQVIFNLIMKIEKIIIN